MRRIVFIFALAAFAANAAGVSSARFGDIGLYDSVVTNVDLSNLTVLETDPTVPSWAKSPTPPVQTETDPTVPAWAKAETPPASGVTTNDVCAIVTNTIDVGWSDWSFSGVPNGATNLSHTVGTNYFECIFYLHDVKFSGMHYYNEDDESVSFNCDDYEGTTIYAITATRQRITQNALGLDRLTDAAISNADTTYTRFAISSPTNVNQSVQYVNIADENPSVLSVVIPEGTGTKDWLIYVMSQTNVTISLPAATWWMADVAYTNDIAPATPTALYFSQIDTGLFLFSRQELAPVTISAP